MHIPENYLSPSTCAVMTAAMLPVWGYSIHKIKTEIPKSKIPLLGIGAAFSFLGMMFNVPLPGGTTGHAVGGTLIAILTGSPAAGCIAVSIALLIQALLFGAVEFGIQPLLFKNAEGQALYCPYPLSVSIPAMMIGHITLFGLAEIILTVVVLTFVEKVTPKALDAVPDKTAFKPLYILMAVLIVLTPLGLLATGTAWGEWGADEIAGLVSGGSQLGYTPSGMTNGFELSTLFPDYSMSGLPEWTGYILSAIVGVALLVIIFKIISSMMKEKVDFKKKAA